MQLQLLAARRAHRAMAKAADAGRVAELAARKAADAEHAHLETRQYESACCRAAARRCRNFPTPQLNQLRPFLDGGKDGEQQQEEDDDDDDEASPEDKENGLLARLEAERDERTRLVNELQALEKEKADKFEEFREDAKMNDELTQRLRAA